MTPVSSILSPLSSRSADLRAATTSLLATPRHFDVEELSHRGWVVAPFADAFTEEQAESLAAATAKRGTRSAIALTTELDVDEEQFEVPMTRDGILAFDRNCLLRYFLLVPRDTSFAVLHEANYYGLIAAPKDFVQETAGVPREVFDNFVRSYVENPGWPDSTAQMLAEIDRYRVLL